MKHVISRVFHLIVVSLTTLSCVSENATPFWESSRTYEFALRVSEEVRVLPERRPFVGEAADTTTIVLQVDSLVRDTLYGTYGAEFMRLGLMMEAIASNARLVRGYVGNDSLRLQLLPDAADTGLWLIGAVRQGQLEGEWYPEIGSGRGTVTARRRSE
jgi:hypothetical protein